jgi:hypothetical protein
MSDQPFVVALIPDLMAEVRFTEAMRAAGIAATVVPDTTWRATLAGQGDSTASGRPALAVVDLTAPGAVAAVEAAVAEQVPVLAYGPHVDGDALGAAREAGAALVVPRGRFVREAAALVGRMLDGAVEPRTPGA